VRELKNCLERALILSGGREIQPPHIQLLRAASSRAQPPRAEAAAFVQTLPLNLEAAEQALIQRALHETGGNVVEAARLLGVNRSRIYRRVSQLSPAATSGTPLTIAAESEVKSQPPD
jgi:DNA-binding NtrC family response regulator